MNINVDSLNEFQTLLQFITSGDKEKIIQGWTNLEELEKNFLLDKTPRNCVDILTTSLKDLLHGTVQNTQELPRLLNWFAKYLDNEPDLHLGYDLANILNNSKLEDIEILMLILNVVNDYKRIFLYGNQKDGKFWKQVVSCLARCHTPINKEEIKNYQACTRQIHIYLSSLIDKSLHSFCLQKLYKIISDTSREKVPGTALCIILLLDKSLIKEGVYLHLDTPYKDPDLVQALFVIFQWCLIFMDNELLSEWLMTFIRGLELKEKYNILMSVAEATLNLNNVFTAFYFEKQSQSVGKILLYMLQMQSNPDVFLTFVDTIKNKNVLNVLKNLNQEYANDCLQTIVDVIEALLIRFEVKDREKIEQTFPVRPREDIVRKILENPFWNVERENKFQLSYVPERSRINIVSIDSIRNVDSKVGLANLGNTCYMNSVLQALAMTRQFRYEVLNYKVNDLGSQVLLSKLQKLFALLMHSKRNSLSPNEIFQVSRPAYFMPGQQQDSSEFLCHLLDVLYEQEKSAIAISGNAETTVDLKPNSDEPMDEIMGDESVLNHWPTEEDLTKNPVLRRKTQSLADFSQGDELPQSQQLSDSHSDSTDSGIQSVGGEDVTTSPSILVHRVFGGESKITYHCQQCDNSSDNTDKFRDLQLCFPEEISENHEVSVQSLINYYLAPEKLTGDNKYRCDKCMNLCDAQRIIKILQAPAHLILTLKHFRYDSDSRLRAKLRHKVAYDETIQLPVLDSEPETYRLYAAVVHSGYSVDYGHYFTYACDSRQKWYRFNDNYVSCTTLEDFKRLEPPDTPYILFYEKSTTVGAFQEDKQELATLRNHLQDIVENDTKSLLNESRYQDDRRKPSFSISRHDNSDDDNNTPSSTCRGSLKFTSNNYLC
ncbi:ubiquitin carboxyl-terminal hydrolase 35 [Leptopilina heterotoma]|uniref:ubiquitin carboxyl-terminal hydrolase 35 n=1 Tax=Leptopilina heterotoma TaxID=63436 RepID=UPI001CA7D854|nr:ubiquitin carboxyl-terminal hydrolase 35 [Leptopilina heterotoma]